MAITLKGFIAKINKKIVDKALFADPLKIGAYTTTAQMGIRIFDEGLNNKYSKDPIYINPDKVFRNGVGKPKGKNSSGNFKNGNERKTVYLEGGYEELRQKIGRQTNVVDSNFSGELRMDFSNQKKIAEPRKVNDYEYQIRLDKEINRKKRQGLESKYGTYFSPTNEEKELFYKTVRFEFINRFSK